MGNIETPLFLCNGDNGSNEAFYCGICEHSIFIRDDSSKIICIQTLGVYERDNVASCEYAEPKKSA